MESLKNDVRELYNLSNEQDKLQNRIKRLKQRILEQYIKGDIHAKFDFDDKKIFLAKGKSSYISRKLIKEILERHYPDLNPEEFNQHISNKLSSNKPYSYISIQKTGMFKNQDDDNQSDLEE